MINNFVIIRYLIITSEQILTRKLLLLIIEVL